MATTRISDVVVPSVFTEYVIANSVEKTALLQSGVLVKNQAITAQLVAGAQSFTVPIWRDLGNEEADIVNDDPDIKSVPKKIGTGKQLVRKSFLHQSWSNMNLASELSGSDALARIQSRVTAYWDRQMQRRLIASLNGILADNLANDSGDMLFDISAQAGTASAFGVEAVIDAAGTLGDSMDAVKGIAMHSDKYRQALKGDLIDFVPVSAGSMRIPTYRGLAVFVDDSMPLVNGVYTTALFGTGAVAYGLTDPRIADGTEVENVPSAGNGGGQEILHTRVNLAVHPAGFTWKEASVAGQSPTIAELALAANWDRTLERKAVQIAFLRSK